MDNNVSTCSPAGLRASRCLIDAAARPDPAHARSIEPGRIGRTRPTLIVTTHSRSRGTTSGHCANCPSSPAVWISGRRQSRTSTPSKARSESGPTSGWSMATGWRLRGSASERRPRRRYPGGSTSRALAYVPVGTYGPAHLFTGDSLFPGGLGNTCVIDVLVRQPLPRRPHLQAESSPCNHDDAIVHPGPDMASPPPSEPSARTSGVARRLVMADRGRRCQGQWSAYRSW